MDIRYSGYRHSVAASNDIARHTPVMFDKKLGRQRQSFNLESELDQILSKYGMVGDTGLEIDRTDNSEELPNGSTHDVQQTYQVPVKVKVEYDSNSDNSEKTLQIICNQNSSVSAGNGIRNSVHKYPWCSQRVDSSKNTMNGFDDYCSDTETWCVDVPFRQYKQDENQNIFKKRYSLDSSTIFNKNSKRLDLSEEGRKKQFKRNDIAQNQKQKYYTQTSSSIEEDVGCGRNDVDLSPGSVGYITYQNGSTDYRNPGNCSQKITSSDGEVDFRRNSIISHTSVVNHGKGEYCSRTSTVSDCGVDYRRNSINTQNYAVDHGNSKYCTQMSSSSDNDVHYHRNSMEFNGHHLDDGYRNPQNYSYSDPEASFRRETFSKSYNQENFVSYPSDFSSLEELTLFESPEEDCDDNVSFGDGIHRNHDGITDSNGNKNELINVKKLETHKTDNEQCCFYVSINQSLETEMSDLNTSEEPLLIEAGSLGTSNNLANKETDKTNVSENPGSRQSEDLKTEHNHALRNSGCNISNIYENIEIPNSSNYNDPDLLDLKEYDYKYSSIDEENDELETDNVSITSSNKSVEPEKSDNKANDEWSLPNPEDVDFEMLKEIVIVRYKALENMMEEALVKNMEIKEDKILSLQSRLDESKNRNVRLQEELRILKRECESLKQRYEEESVGSERHGTKVNFHGPLGALRNTHVSQNNPTKDILDLKDHLVNLERTNATLMTENKNMKSHTDSLNQQIQKLDRHNSQLQSQTASLQDHNSSFQSQIAKLQVEYSTLQAQCSSLQGQCQILQNQLNRVESEHQHLIQTHEELQTTHEQLVGDHEDLQRLHEQLSSEHEALISQHGSLKSLHKSLKNENRELTIRLQERNGNSYGMSVQEKEKINADLQSFESLKMEYNHMREKHEIVYNQHEKIRKDYLDLSKEHKQLKTDYNCLRGNCDDYKNQLHEMELELSNLGNKYDSLYQANQKMEDDNKNLLMQVQALLNTNSELLTQILNSKDTIAEEQKSYLERLGDLRRQKERLEEKIMEAYKRQETQKKNKGLGARIARKAAKIFVTKNHRSKSRNNLTDLSADNTSHGSNEITENGDSAKKSDLRKRSNSADNLLDTSSFATHKTFAKSTTALHMLSGGSGDYDNSLRGSKSTEDLLAAGSPSLLPGLGRPANLGDDEDDDGGFGNRSENNNEMLTLEQFLSESSKTSNHSRGNKSENREDLESKSSENSSENSVNRRRRQAPNPPSDNRISIPDVVSQSQIELNLSRMSRISAGSSGSGYESRPDSLDQSTPPQSKRDHPETSTPAYNNINNNIRKFEEAGYSPLVKPDFRKHSLGSTPSTASRTLQYVYPSPYKSPQNRELPPTPNDTPSDRLDRLAGFSQSQSQNSSNSSSLYSNNQDSSVQYDQSIRSGPTSRYRAGSPVRSNQTFSPGVQQGRPPSAASHHNSSPQTNGQLPPSGQLLRGQSLNRPQTFHESQQNNIYFSIDDNKQNENRPENHYARVQRIERPKSVPPNMFEALQNQENMNNRPKDMHNVSKGTPPKPPPRRSREPPLTTGRVSLLREPGANRSGGRQLPQTDTYRSSTPTLRKDTPPRQVPVNEEPPKDPKANSVWYEYGCV
ncbi:protein Daple-like isoform X9 [Mytilus edulis]|uniref:protein Daple-like isoform X9 n=1 Tax=Mytilus edulis TaxID=6550 RepID=UPI0039EF39AD